MIRPTRKAVWLFAAGIPPALFMVIYDRDLWPFSFDYGLLILLMIALDAALAFPPRLLAIKIEPPDKLYVGERGAVRVTIAAARHPRRTGFELLLEQHGDLDPAQIVAADLPVGHEARAELALLPRRRGRVGLSALWVRWFGPLKLVERARRMTMAQSIDVLPNIHGVKSAALQFFAQEAIFGVKVQHNKGEGAEFEALRDYAPGLDTRVIDWKQSARHRKLVCKEFRTERNHHVILSFDTGHLMLEPIDGLPRLDHAINAGLLLTWISLQSGDFVGLYGFDAMVRHYLHPSRGIPNFTRILRATAELDYHPEETNFTLGLAELNARLRRRALVVLFTDFVDTVTAELLIDSMARIANRHVVIFVTLRDSLLQHTVDAPPRAFDNVARAVVAQDFLRDRSIVFERLDRLGIHCLDVPSRTLSAGLINRYLLIKQRGLIG